MTIAILLVTNIDGKPYCSEIIQSPSVTHDDKKIDDLDGVVAELTDI